MGKRSHIYIQSGEDFPFAIHTRHYTVDTQKEVREEEHVVK